MEEKQASLLCCLEIKEQGLEIVLVACTRPSLVQRKSRGVDITGTAQIVLLAGSCLIGEASRWKRLDFGVTTTAIDLGLSRRE